MSHELYSLFQHLGDAEIDIAREIVEHFGGDCLNADGFGDVFDVFGVPERHFGACLEDGLGYTYLPTSVLMVCTRRGEALLHGWGGVLNLATPRHNLYNSPD
jgi:hypothetical protein